MFKLIIKESSHVMKNKTHDKLLISENASKLATQVNREYSPAIDYHVASDLHLCHSS